MPQPKESSYCPRFECLAYNQKSCAAHYACEGCDRLYHCDQCSHQASVAENGILLCDLMNLPERCRSCELRESESFSPTSDCTLCLGIRNLSI